MASLQVEKTTPSEPVALSDEVQVQIDHWLTKFPADQKRSAVLPALRLTQEENGGWLSQAHMDAVAEYLGVPKIAVYEVATFYSMYELEPVGKYKLMVCTNISCMLCGSNEVVAHLKKRLGVGFGETTQDGKFTLKEAECLAFCVQPPVMQVNDKDNHLNLTVEKIDQIIDELEKK